MFYLYTTTYSNICAFGGRPRQFSGLSAYDQLLFSDQVFFFFGSIHGPRMDCFFFVSSLFCFPTFICAQHEGTNQAPTAAVFTYHELCRTACNRSCTEHQSTNNSTLMSIRGRQRKQADKSESIAESQTIFPLLLFVAVAL